MKITLNQTVKYGGKYHKPGETIDCKKNIADDLLKAGIAAKYTAPAPPEEPEEPEEEVKGDGTGKKLPELDPENPQRQDGPADPAPEQNEETED